MNYRHVLSPIQIGPMYLKNRVSFSPVWPSFATCEGHVNRELMEWIRDLAAGGAACINIGCGIVNRNLPPYVTHLIRLADEGNVNELSQAVDLAHMYGARIGIELFAINLKFGDFENRDKKSKKPAVELDPSFMSREEIHSYIEDFSLAAQRAQRCGFDSVVVHGAHGQLPGCFLSKVINEREDEYGTKTMEDRSRFAAELLTGIREKVGNSIAVEYRINASDMYEGAPSLDETIEFMKMIEDKVDLFHISRGMHSMQNLTPYMNQPLYYPHGMNLEDAAVIKKALHTPVTVVGSVTLEQADRYIGEGKIDMVSMARGLMADPQMINNARRGEERKTRPCVRCNTCINLTHYYLAPLRCAVNPEMGMETLYMNFHTPVSSKKVAVIGGGPAGMEAARTACMRGHRVTLFEKNEQLGGILNMASKAPFKKDMKNYLEWSVSRTKEMDIDICCNTEITPEEIRDKYDAVLVAIGAKPVLPEKFAGNDKVTWIGDVENGKETGDKIVIAGAGLTGCEGALNLAGQKKKVTLIDVLPAENFASGGAKFNQIALLNMLKEAGVRMEGNTTLTAVNEEGAVVEQNGIQKVIPCSDVILSLGVKPDKKLIQSFNDTAADVIYIGDCFTQRGNLYNAIHSAHEAAMTI